MKGPQNQTYCNTEIPGKNQIDSDLSSKRSNKNVINSSELSKSNSVQIVVSEERTTVFALDEDNRHENLTALLGSRVKMILE